MQDANLRSKNKYRFMLYDRMGRLCVQGLCDSFDHSVNVSNGNIEHMQRRGRKQDGHVGKIDNLSIFHHGNQLSSVVDDAAKVYYAGIFNFNGDGKNEAHYKYNDSGSLIEDTGRGITNIEYDNWNNPKRIQFDNGNITEYVFTATGTKLRTVHYTAVPNISVPAGTTHRLSTSEILSKDSTDYHGNLIVENGKPDKYLFAGGFASLRNSADGKPEIAFHYYDQDHLGNNRAVVSARTGAVEQITNYYPFGMPYTDQTAVNPDFQKYKYNGKELDKMHGLNTYDYGARQYYSIVPAWDRIDPLCEKYYNISPYAYCEDNPISLIDNRGTKLRLFNNAYDLVVCTLPVEERKYIKLDKDGFINQISLKEGVADGCSDNLKYLNAIVQDERVVDYYGAVNTVRLKRDDSGQGNFIETTFNFTAPITKSELQSVLESYDHSLVTEQLISFLKGEGISDKITTTGNLGKTLRPDSEQGSYPNLGERSLSQNIEVYTNNIGTSKQQQIQNAGHELYSHVIFYLLGLDPRHNGGNNKELIEREKQVERDIDNYNQ